MNIKKVLLGGCVLLVAFVAGCSKKAAFSPDDIVAKVMAAEKQGVSYAAEGEDRQYANGKLTDQSNIKEWFDDKSGKRRYEVAGKDEVVTVNDGKKVTLYFKDKNEAYSMDVSDGGTGQPMSQKEQVVSMLDSMKKTHQIQILGEEKILNRDTYHVKLASKQKATLLGNMELWVDAKNWMILKSAQESGQMKFEFAYTKLDLSPKFTDETFTLKLPENVKVKPFQDMNPAKKVTLQEAETALGKPFLYFADPAPADIELLELKGEINRNEITIRYTKDNLPFVSLSVFPTPSGENAKLGLPDEKPVTVHGVEGSFLKDARSVT
jgi:outer membrane lipoprotein-sorting protein